MRRSAVIHGFTRMLSGEYQARDPVNNVHLPDDSTVWSRILWFVIRVALIPVCWVIDYIQHALYGEDETPTRWTTKHSNPSMETEPELSEGPPSRVSRAIKGFQYRWKRFLSYYKLVVDIL